MTPIKRVERPIWGLNTDNPIHFNCITEKGFNNWFDKEVEPLNKLLDSSEEVFITKERPECWAPGWKDCDPTHKGLIIGIEPIQSETETCADVLRRILDSGMIHRGDVDRVKAALARAEGEGT